MMGDELVEVDIAYPIAVGETEGFIVKKRGHALQAAAGHGLGAGVDQGYLPWFGVLLVDLHGVVAHVEGDIGHVQEIVGKVLLDYIALVAQADDELIDAIVRIDFHDVPEDRLAADLHHGLGLEIGLLADPGAEAAGKDDCFHVYHQLL